MIRCGALFAAVFVIVPGAISMSAIEPVAAAGVPGAVSQTVWLCRPGIPDDPCGASLNATVVTASGAMRSQPGQAASNPPFDCFYVYPTVSTQHRVNANLRIQRAQIAVAVGQASRFSQVCAVWAPVYRQRTASSIAAGVGSNPRADGIAYASVLSAWRDYITNENQGRPFILIGHSQGAAMLIRLLRNVIEPSSALRHRLVSALVIGGNVQVPPGKLVGGTFSRIPGCSSNNETGCVIAYSSFPRRPPVTSAVGRAGQGVSVQSGQTRADGSQVLCTNPARLAGGSADLSPYFLANPSGTGTPGAPWVSYPGLYRARCLSSGGATWLQVTASTVRDGRPRVTEQLGANWGYHVDDVNLAIGNLVSDVAHQEASYRATHR